MDAKPHRPLRALKIHDENQILQPLKSLHHRNKSSPALSTLAQTNNTKLALKRTAFADVSNVARPLGSIRDDSVLKSKTENVAGKEKVARPDSLKAAPLQQPAQRPVSVGTLKSLLNTFSSSASQKSGHTNSSQAAIVDLPVPAPTNTLSRRATSTLQSLNESELEVVAAPLPAIYKPTARRNTTATIPATCILTDQSCIQGLSSPLFHDAETGLCQQETHESLIEPSNHVVTSTKVASAASSNEPASNSAPPLATDVTSKPDFANDLERCLNPRESVQRSAASEGWDCLDEDEEDGYTTMRSLRSRGDYTTNNSTIVLAPKITAKVERELAVARHFVQSSKEAAELEEDEAWDTSMVAEYGEDIFKYMRELESRMLPNAYYMDNQTEVQWSMRSVLMDWLVQVHHRFGLLPETLFLTVNYIDRFLSCKVVSLGKLQLVGATAIFVAAKYEEINCPSVNEIVYMVDNGYTPDEILKAERFMLTMLQFELGWPGPMSFLRRISKADDYDLETRTLAKYFLEITIMDERFVGTPPSFTAAASHCLARLMLQKGTWSSKHVYYSGYTYSQLQLCLNTLLSCCEDPHKHHAAVFEKYQDKRFKRAAIFVQDQIASGFCLPAQARLSLANDPESADRMKAVVGAQPVVS